MDGIGATLLHGLHRRLAFERRLGQLVVVQGHIAQQSLLQVFTAAEPMGLESITDATVGPLHHPVGCGRPGLGQPVLDTQLLAQPIKLMVAAGLALLAGKQAVCKFLAVVGQELVDPDWAGLVQSFEKGLCAGSTLVG